MSFELQTGFRTLNRIPAHVPQKLLRVMDTIFWELDGNFRSNEYAIVAQTWFDEEGGVHVNMDPGCWTVPRQFVTPSSVRLADHCDREKFGAIVHRHPHGCNMFSQTDAEYINQHFDVSLLYMHNNLGGFIADGVVNVEYVGNSQLQLPADIHVVGEGFEWGRQDNHNIGRVEFAIQPEDTTEWAA